MFEVKTPSTWLNLCALGAYEIHNAHLRVTQYYILIDTIKRLDEATRSLREGRARQRVDSVA